MAVSAPPLADLVTCNEHTLVPAPPPRVLQMASLRQQGWTLDEIATPFMISRERVRQILHAHGGPDRRDAAEARRRRTEQLAEERVDELLSQWRAGSSPDRIAVTGGLPAAACRSTIERFATDVDHAARRASQAGSRGRRTYSDSDIVRALRVAATELGRAPSGKEYAGLARGMRLPSLATVVNRMGGWSDAVIAAGLRPVAAPSRPRRRRWTQDACREAIERAIDELGKIPSLQGYEAFAAGRTDLPSSATIRNRLGGWSSLGARLHAERAVPQQAQTPVRSRGSV